MKKTRRQSQSPSSTDSSSSLRRPASFFGGTHKRRNVRKDSGITEATESMCSCSSDKTDSAPWRVENIRPIPPRSDEWWTAEFYDIGERHEHKVDEGFEAILPSSLQVPPETSKFRNCGLETWLRAREEWKRRTVETLPPKPTPAERNMLVKGLIKHSAERTYELPRKMALSDLIEVYTDIWEGQGN